MIWRLQNHYSTNKRITAMVQTDIIELAKKYKDVLSEVIEFDNIFLYGSYSRGTAKQYSDIDIAIIMKKCDDDYMKTLQLLWKLRNRIDSRIEPVLFIEDEDETGFLEEIKRTGIKIN
ncbi:nucleotidyltransferase domain-containing protein [Bacteroidota bacterium]